MRGLPRSLSERRYQGDGNCRGAGFLSHVRGKDAKEAVISDPKLINLLIAGIGRQGINSLAKVLAKSLRAAGRSCQYTVHKGGAQSLGSVYAELRIATGELPVLGPSIPSGKLDILVAMDPWEALRHLRLAHTGTAFYVESQVMPFFTDRSSAGGREESLGCPIERLGALPVRITWRRYRADAIDRAQTANMANYLVGLDCLSALGLDNVNEYRRIFFDTIPAAQKGAFP